MAKDTTLIVSVKDNASSVISNMRNHFQAFDKNVEGVQKRLSELNTTKAELQVDTKRASDNISAAHKELKNAKEGTEEFERALRHLEEAYSDHNQLASNLKLVSDEARQAEKDLKSLADTQSRTENRAGGSSITGDGSSSIFKTFAASGAAAMLGNTLSGIASTYVGSSFGNEASILFDNTLSSASMGAAIGTTIAPGIGTAVGTVLGGVVGYINGQTQVFENKDEAFKSYYHTLYEEVTGQQNERLQRGIPIAQKREVDQISFSALLGGESEASNFLSGLVDFASVTPFDYDTLTDVSKTLLAYGYQQNEIVPLLTKIGDTGATLGMSSSDVNAIAKALGRMEISDKATLEYLNPLLERGIDVWGYLAEAGGRTKEEVMEMVHDGLVPGAEAAKAIADYMGADSLGGMQKQAETYFGLISTLGNAQAELDNAMGRGYADTRKKGLADEIEWLGGESGAMMNDAYYKIGQWEASLENKKDELERDAFDAVMTGKISANFEDPEIRARLANMYKEYRKFNMEGTEEAANEMGALLAEAQTIAINEYNASEGAQLQLNTQLSLIDSIASDTSLNEKYYNAGYELMLEFSKGMLEAKNNLSNPLTPSINTGIPTIDNPVNDSLGIGHNALQPGGTTRYLNIFEDKYKQDFDGLFKGSPGHAIGLNRVPYDNFPAMLHEGERVLTAREARNYDKWESGKHGIENKYATFVKGDDNDSIQYNSQISYKADTRNVSTLIQPQTSESVRTLAARNDTERSLIGDIAYFEKEYDVLPMRGFAYGLERVPYDNFPALLHEGERVLTASEARTQNGVPNITVNISGEFKIDSEESIDKTAQVIVNRITQAFALMG